MMVPPALRALVSAYFSSLLDPHPLEFRARDERGVGVVRAACPVNTREPVKIGRPLPRNAFLCGVLDLIEHAEIEHLVVGLGHRFGSTTRVEQVGHAVGSIDRVSIPMDPWRAAERWLDGQARGEVLIVHNHPRNMLNVLFDNLPIASATDRDTWLRALVQGKRIRCYLVENGFVREFRTPGILGLIDKRMRDLVADDFDEAAPDWHSSILGTMNTDGTKDPPRPGHLVLSMLNG